MPHGGLARPRALALLQESRHVLHGGAGSGSGTGTGTAAGPGAGRGGRAVPAVRTHFRPRAGHAGYRNAPRPPPPRTRFASAPAAPPRSPRRSRRSADPRDFFPPSRRLSPRPQRRERGADPVRGERVGAGCARARGSAVAAMERAARALLAAGERRARGEPRELRELRAAPSAAPSTAPSTAVLSLCSPQEPLAARAPPRQRRTGRRGWEVGGQCPAEGAGAALREGEDGDPRWDGMGDVPGPA